MPRALMLNYVEQCRTTSESLMAESKAQDDQKRRNALKMVSFSEQTQKYVF